MDPSNMDESVKPVFPFWCYPVHIYSPSRPNLLRWVEQRGDDAVAILNSGCKQPESVNTKGIFAHSKQHLMGVTIKTQRKIMAARGLVFYAIADCVLRTE